MEVLAQINLTLPVIVITITIKSDEMFTSINQLLAIDAKNQFKRRWGENKQSRLLNYRYRMEVNDSARKYRGKHK